ncbi:MAG TPA: CHAD domain-containing protein, partial [Deinococcales bacterium]|nr:CHAD domain-containing protein [Deinococcales bacterium]
DAGPDAARRALRRVHRRAGKVLKTPESGRAHERRLHRAHDLRKAVKRLRYSLEFLRPVADTAEAVSALKELQGTLGRLNDHANASDTLRRLAEGLERDEAASSLDLAGGHDHSANQALDELPGELESLHWARLERHLKAALRGGNGGSKAG